MTNYFELWTRRPCYYKLFRPWCQLNQCQLKQFDQTSCTDSIWALNNPDQKYFDGQWTVWPPGIKWKIDDPSDFAQPSWIDTIEVPNYLRAKQFSGQWAIWPLDVRWGQVVKITTPQISLKLHELIAYEPSITDAKAFCRAVNSLTSRGRMR